MPFAATLLVLEITMISESEKDKYHIRSLICDKNVINICNKNETKELIHKTETDSKILKPNLCLLKGNSEGRDKLGIWD